MNRAEPRRLALVGLAALAVGIAGAVVMHVLGPVGVTSAGPGGLLPGTSPTTPQARATETPGPSQSLPASPSQTAAASPSSIPIAAQPGLPPGARDLARQATVTAPAAPPPGPSDPRGFGPFTPQAMVDGRHTGGWRVPGDASGDVIVLTFPNRVTVGAVGLDPGDDLTDPATGADLWSTRRVVSSVEITFDDGTTYAVALRWDVDVPHGDRLQLAYLQAPETTQTIRIRIDTTETLYGTVDQTVVTRVAVVAS